MSEIEFYYGGIPCPHPQGLFLLEDDEPTPEHIQEYLAYYER